MLGLWTAGCGPGEGTFGEHGLGTSEQAVTVCPSAPVPGVDVSVYQGSIDWGQVAAAGYRWGYAKATEGTGYQDPTFPGNWSGMAAHGLYRGAYHFFHPGVNGTAQADYYLAYVGSLSAALPPMLDWEVNDGVGAATADANAQAFIAEIRAKTGREAVIYTAPGWWDGQGYGNFGAQPLWVADWTYSTGTCPFTPSGWGGYVFWQWNDKGSVPGIPKVVDLDVFNGGAGALGALADLPPQGWLDSVDCTQIAGWAWDPDSPNAAIDVDFYFGGQAGSGAPGIRWLANVDRPDLCTAIGSCDHGYVVPSPRSFMDGNPHGVYPYGIDPSGNGDNPLLSGAPKNIACVPAESGVRRHVVDPTSYAAWQFSGLMDVRPVPDATFDAWPEAQPWPGTPQLVQGAGAPEVWLVDGPFRRHVVSPDSAAAWHFDLATMVTQLPLAQVQAMPQGPDLRGRPTLVKGSGPEIDVLDDPLPVLDAGSDAGEGDAGVADAGTVDGGRALDAGTARDAGSDAVSTADAGPDGGVRQDKVVRGGCGCGAGGDGSGFAALLFGLGAVLTRRRRSTGRSSDPSSGRRGTSGRRGYRSTGRSSWDPT